MWLLASPLSVLPIHRSGLSAVRRTPRAFGRQACGSVRRVIVTHARPYTVYLLDSLLHKFQFGGGPKNVNPLDHVRPVPCAGTFGPCEFG